MSIQASELGIKGALAQEDAPQDSKTVLKWLNEMGDARKREDKWRKAATSIVEIYEGQKKELSPYNILCSNTETLQPALYNSTPRPIVARRFKDEDPLGKMAGKVGERALEYLIDSGNAAYTSFDDLMASAVLEALVPGRGLTRFKYDATIVTRENEAAAATVSEDEREGDETDDVETEPAAPVEEVQNETVCGEEIPWNRFLHGNAKKWRDVPWCAVEHFMTREELEKNFGKVGAKVPVTETDSGSNTGSEDNSEARKDELKGMKVAQVFEIWDKEGKNVIFVSPQWKSAPLRETSDPLQLTGFYPWPQPLTFTSKISSLLPVALYTMYEEQAKELNIITVRLKRILAAMKVRGLYDATVEGIDKVLQSEDNTLVPAENVAALLAQGNALEKAIWLMPIEKLVAVVQQLYVSRVQIKTVIYEITGIADIMRGSSQASETLGAQEIKNQWGTLRLKKTQKAVMRYCRDCLRIILEIAVSKLSPQTLKAMTGLPFPMMEEKQQAQQQLAMMKQQYEGMAQQAQMMGQQPPPPPQIPPELQQAAAMPSMEEVLDLLKNDTMRSYRIDIETNSTVDAEATEDKQDISELLNAISQFVNGMSPMVQSGTMPFEVVQSMLLAVVRRYRFGGELEDQLKQMKKPEGGNPEEVKKQQAEVQKAQQQVMEERKKVEEEQRAVQQQTEDAKREIEAASKEAQAELAAERKAFELEKQFAQKELEMNKQFAVKELALQGQVADAQHQLKVQSSEQKLSLKASMQGEDIKRQSDAVASKAKEVGQKEQKLDPQVMMQPLVQALSEGFASMGKELKDGLTSAAQTQKRAVRQSDGSWSTETVKG